MRWLRRLLLTRVALLALSCGFSLVVAEAVARALERVEVSRTHLAAAKIPDPLLGVRIRPNGLGSDGWGFRNATVPTSAAIVALGDSQTWGVNARPGETWPAQLAARLGVDVYNMSLGGYGTLHYWVLLPQALDLRPRIVILAIYLGNDLYDTYRLAYTNPRHAAWRTPELNDSLAEDTLEPIAGALWEQQLDYQQAYGRDDPATWGLWLRGHTALGRWLERDGLWRSDVWHAIGAAWADAHPENGSVWRRGKVRTVFTTQYRLLALDLDEPRIREGLRISLAVLRRVRDDVAGAKVHLLVATIPTKESAYGPLLEGNLSPTHAALIQWEAKVTSNIRAFCSSESIAFVDVAANLGAALLADEPLYPETTESHPNPSGYAVIAETLAKEIDRQGWLGGGRKPTDLYH